MPLFSKKHRCDWCGIRFKHAPIEVEGLTFCGQTCLAQRQAPERAAPAEEPSLDAALGDMKQALTQFESYRRRSSQAVRAKTAGRMEKRLVEADVAYVDGWRYLEGVQRTLAREGLSSPRFEVIKRFGFGAHRSYELDRSYSLGINLSGFGLVEKTSATVNLRTSVILSHAATRELQHRIDQLAERKGQAPPFAAGPPDEPTMQALLEACETERSRGEGEPDLMGMLERGELDV